MKWLSGERRIRFHGICRPLCLACRCVPVWQVSCPFFLFRQLFAGEMPVLGVTFSKGPVLGIFRG